MIKNKSFLFLQSDFKAESWSLFLRSKNHHSLINKNKYPYSIFLFFLQLYNSFNRDRVTVFRYLNDRKSFFNSFFNLITDFFLVLFNKIFFGKIYWIKHNIDNETYIYYPLINKLRKRILSSFSDKIFVLDQNLIKYLPKSEKKKADWICFGVYENQIDVKLHNNIKNQIKLFKEKFSKETTPITGLTISSGLPKFKHFEQIPDLINKLNQNSENPFLFIIIGKLPESRKKDLLEIYKNNDYLLYIKNEKKLNIKFFIDLFEYSCRSVDDMSVSYSVYDLVENNKPLVTFSDGFLGEFVEFHGLGVSLKNTSDIKNFKEKIFSVEKKNFSKFKQKYSWKIGASKMIK